ncbi:MAG: hypothetical protein HFH46_01775 [Bacilli bacterium]|nr:hypothetical protein [Bacilli bacterium]
MYITELVGDNVNKCEDLRKLIGAGTIEKHRMLKYGFIEKNDQKDCFVKEFYNGDLSLVLNVIDGELISFKIIDNSFGDECFEILQSREDSSYWTLAINEYNELIKDFVLNCVKPENVRYLLPEQVAFMEEKIQCYGRYIQRLTNTCESILESRVFKKSGGHEGNGTDEVETATEEMIKIEQTFAQIEEIQDLLNNSTLPMPEGEDIIIGSFVEICTKKPDDSMLINRVLIVEEVYDVSIKSEDGTKMCMTNSNLGQVLMGHKEGDVVTLANGNSVVITVVDNNYVYNRYSEYYHREGVQLVK